MSRIEYTRWDISDTERVVWYWDEEYTSSGSFAYDTDEETEKAERDEAGMIERGEYVVLGFVHERTCPGCGQWTHVDSCWGIVIEPDETAIRAYARGGLGLPVPGIEEVIR